METTAGIVKHSMALGCGDRLDDRRRNDRAKQPINYQADGKQGDRVPEAAKQEQTNKGTGGRSSGREGANMV